MSEFSELLELGIEDGEVRDINFNADRIALSLVRYNLEELTVIFKNWLHFEERGAVWGSDLSHFAIIDNSEFKTDVIHKNFDTPESRRQMLPVYKHVELHNVYADYPVILLVAELVTIER